MPWSRLNSSRHPVDDPLVEVVAAEVPVAARGAHLHDAVADVEDRDVEGAAAEVEHEDRLRALLVDAVGERRGGRLVDDPQDVEAGDPAGVLRRLALGVVEVGRDRDDGLVDLLAQALGAVLGELAQDDRRDLLGRVLLAADLDADGIVGSLDDLVGDHLGLLLDLLPLASDEPLDRVDRVLGVEDHLALGDLADQPLPVLGERDDRRRRALALGVGDHLRLAALHRCCHDRVGRAEIDSNRLGHCRSSSVASEGDGRGRARGLHARRDGR